MKQKDIEARLSKLQDENPQDPEIYELLVQLTANMLRSQNWLLADIDFDNVSHDVAADLYMYVYTQKYHIEFWRAMAYRLIKFCHVKKQRKIAMTQVFDTYNDPTRRELIFKTCTSYTNSYEKEAAVAENKAYLSDIRLVIEEVLNNSKFNKSSSDYLNLYTSVCLSLLKGEDTYYHLNEGLHPYVRILVESVKQKIFNSGLFSASANFDVFANPLYKNALIPDLSYLET